MRRVVLALGGTIAGLVMLLSFRTHMGSTAVAGVSGTGGTAGSGGSTSAGSGGSAPAAPRRRRPLPSVPARGREPSSPGT